MKPIENQRALVGGLPQNLEGLGRRLLCAMTSSGYPSDTRRVDDNSKQRGARERELIAPMIWRGRGLIRFAV